VFCEPAKRNVEIETVQQISDGDGNLLETSYRCNAGMYVNKGVKMYKPCKMADDENCLLKKCK